MTRTTQSTTPPRTLERAIGIACAAQPPEIDIRRIDKHRQALVMLDDIATTGTRLLH